jgi:hypothetical protein
MRQVKPANLGGERMLDAYIEHFPSWRTSAPKAR